MNIENVKMWLILLGTISYFAIIGIALYQEKVLHGELRKAKERRRDPKLNPQGLTDSETKSKRRGRGAGNLRVLK